MKCYFEQEGISMDKIYHLTYKGEKIPYEFTNLKRTIILNHNLKDYPREVDKILKRKYPHVIAIQHHTHYADFEQDDVVRRDADKLEDKYYIVRNRIGYATVHRVKDDKEMYYISNLEEFTTSSEIDEDDDGMILFTLDSSGVVSLK